MKQLLSFWKDESGATALEYGLILSLIVIGSITTLSTIGNQTITPFNKANNAFAQR
jgi:pilus assembly protein Flp/PilA